MWPPSSEPGLVGWWSAGIAHVPGDGAWIDDLEAERFAAMAFTKRRDEARLARYTAKATVARFLERPIDPASLRAITIRNAPDGAPEVTVDGRAAGIVIAMTDRADWAVSAVVRGADRIGCDLELIETRSERFVRDYFTTSEQRATHAAPRPDLMANLIWSAKESALKVLRTGLRRDTRTVRVEVTDGSPEEWSPLTVTTAEGGALPGWWIRYGEFVLTVVGAAPTPPPHSLEEPPPLAAGAPSHSWLESPRVTGSS